MKSIDGSSKMKFLFLMMLSFIMMISCYVYHNYSTYKSIKVVAEESATVEYGSANYDVKKLLKAVEGEVISVKKDIDTSVIGEQEVIFEVKKDNIIKEVPVKVMVVDTIAPVVNIKQEKITITKGEEIDLLSNIESVVDEIDGEIAFSDDTTLENSNYYSLNYGNDITNVGSHEVKVTAYDKSGNLSTFTFILEVLEPEPEPVVEPAVAPVVSNALVNPAGNDLVSIAKSLVGAPYVAGSNGPYGFDCSGFVQYVYSRMGINISRSSSTQLHEGVPVSYQDAQPGDILSWGYVDGVSTHSALYIGNGQMIHATNPRQGVIASDVAAWTRGSGTRVISVRRIN